MEVRGKVCIITGSAQGLGRAFAMKLLEAEAKVCLSDLNKVMIMFCIVLFINIIKYDSRRMERKHWQK